MNSEPDVDCPKCGNIMEIITADEGTEASCAQCPVCATLVWNGKDRNVENQRTP